MSEFALDNSDLYDEEGAREARETAEVESWTPPNGFPRVIFKDEGEIDGMPFGPVTIIERPEDEGSRPFRTRCVCDAPAGERPGPCRNCGDWRDPEWVALETAERLARQRGVELEVS
jgi:hypothetical protein